MSKKAPVNKVRSVVLAVGFAATTVAGAWYGAGLKTERDIKKDVKARAESTPADKIAFLEQTRSGLAGKKMELERKIEQLETRMAENKKKKGGEAGASAGAG